MSYLAKQLLRFRDLLAFLVPQKKSRLIALVTFGVLLSIGVLVIVAPVHADVSFEDIPNGILMIFTQILLAIAQLFIRLTIFFLQFFILVAGYNNYINAPVVELGWNMVRDLTNMFFVVALLAIAFGTILGIESYEWRKLLPKLLLAALLVNFSNLICQLVIDISQVFMTTFLNAIAGAAGGNLIQMFNFQEIFKISTAGGNATQGSGSDLRLDVFISGVIAITFAGMAMITILAYTVIILVRMVVLWALIVLSPLAFVFSTLPVTKKYADDFWTEFTNYVLVGPIMVFFLWLAFASFGGGGVVGEHIEQGHKIEGAKITGRTDQTGNPVQLGLSEAASYDNIANFLVALAFLYIGLERVQKMGVKGSGMVGSAMKFGEYIGTRASGYAAGRWLAGGAKDLAVKSTKKAVGAGLYHMPLGGRFWKTSAEYATNRIKQGYGEHRQRKEEAYAKWEKDMGDKGRFGAARIAFARARGAVGGGVLGGQSRARFEKIAEDWKDAAERQKEIVEESYGTGSTTKAGAVKQNVTARKKAQEQMIAEKKAKKIELEEQAIRNRVKNGTATDLERSAVAHLEGAAKDRSERTVLRRDKELDDAEREAGVLKKQGKDVEAQAVMDSVRKKHLKERQDVFDNMDWNPRINMAGEVAGQLKDSTLKPEKAQNLRADATRLLTAAAENGSDQFNEMLDTMIETIYDGHKQSMTNDNAGQRILEAITGQKINTMEEFDAAHKLVAKGSGTFSNAGEAQASLSALSNALKRQGSDGGVRSAGAVVESKVADVKDFKEIDIEAGAKSAFRFAAGENLKDTRTTADQKKRIEADQKSKRDMEKFFQTRVDLKGVTNLQGYMSVKQGKVSQINADQQKQLIAALSRFGDEHKVSGGFSSTTAAGNTLENFSGVGKMDMESVLAEVKKNYAGSEGLQKAFNKLMETQFKEFMSNDPALSLYEVNQPPPTP